MSSLPYPLPQQMAFVWPRLARWVCDLVGLVAGFRAGGVSVLPRALARRLARGLRESEGVLRAWIMLRAVELAGAARTVPELLNPVTASVRETAPRAPGFRVFERVAGWPQGGAFPVIPVGAPDDYVDAGGLLARLSALQAAMADPQPIAARLSRHAARWRGALCGQASAVRPKRRALPVIPRLVPALAMDPRDVDGSLIRELTGEAIRALDQYICGQLPG